jgi:GntP family gluconate:H+ symporter
MALLLALGVVVALTIVATARFKIHPFLTLLLASIVMGFVGGLSAADILGKLTEGFGSTLQSIGIVIAFGTVIGTSLERSGAAQAMADAVLRIVGERRSPLAMSITGYIVSVPVFCDSGFVILSALNRALSRKTGLSLAVLAVALGTGLYATHVFVPPTPGPLAGAATLGADIGLVIALGLVVSLPAAAAGLLWAVLYARRFHIMPGEGSGEEYLAGGSPNPPGAAVSFAPIVAPIILIALRSIADFPTAPFGTGPVKAILGFIGHPAIALLIGVLLAFLLPAPGGEVRQMDWVMAGLRSAGSIILITGAGGAFGNVLRSTGIGDVVGRSLTSGQFGLFLPFVISAVVKTAQGSSTVAIITTSALMAPLLPAMGLSSAVARTLVVLAIGAGSMVVSHVNDSYFWVVAQFSDMETSTALRAHSLATLVQGIVGALTVALLGWILL